MLLECCPNKMGQSTASLFQLISTRCRLNSLTPEFYMHAAKGKIKEKKISNNNYSFFHSWGYYHGAPVAYYWDADIKRCYESLRKRHIINQQGHITQLAGRSNFIYAGGAKRKKQKCNNMAMKFYLINPCRYIICFCIKQMGWGQICGALLRFTQGLCSRANRELGLKQQRSVKQTQTCKKNLQ